MKYEEAILVFKEVIEIEPRNVQAYLGISEAYVALEKPEEAITWLETGISEIEAHGEVIEGCEELYIKESEIYESLDQKDKAEDVLYRGYVFTHLELFIKLLEKLTGLSYEEIKSQFINTANNLEDTQSDEVIEEAVNSELPELTEEELSFIHDVYEALKNEDLDKCHQLVRNGNTELSYQIYYDGTQVRKTYNGLGLYFDKSYDWVVVYYGDLVDGVWEGKGISYFSYFEEERDSYKYFDGEWKDGKANGYGKKVYRVLTEEGIVSDKSFVRTEVVEGTYKDGLEHGSNKRWYRDYFDESEVPIYMYEAIEGKLQDGGSVKYNSEENMYWFYDDEGNRRFGIPADDLTHVSAF